MIRLLFRVAARGVIRFLLTLYFEGKSKLSYLKNLGRRDQVHILREFAPAGRPVVIISIFQNSPLRQDLQLLVKRLDEIGAQIVVVNSGTFLFQEWETKPHVQINRPNLGRDFGSYKSGLLWFLEQKGSEKASSLSLLNDSVYFFDVGLDKFLTNFLGLSNLGPEAVVAVTENWEFEPHLASYALTFKPRIFLNPKFVQFWQSLRTSNVRPTTIQRGEIGLSKNINSIIERTGIEVLLNANRVFQAWRTLDANVFKLGNVGGLRRSETLAAFEHSIIAPSERLANFEVRSNHEFSDKSSKKPQAEDFLLAVTKTYAEMLENSSANQALQLMFRGSHIHEASKLCFSLGIPLVKLDSFYRGVSGWTDMNDLFAEQMVSPVQQREFLSLVTRRGNGYQHLHGLKKIFFDFGFQ